MRLDDISVRLSEQARRPDQQHQRHPSAGTIVYKGIDITHHQPAQVTRSGEPGLVEAFGINVPRMATVTYGLGVALAAFAGVLAAPIYRVSPAMGADMIIVVFAVVFAVVVIGGMGSIMGRSSPALGPA
jgi:Branched-chain amino acid transport system / permease component